MDRIMSTKPDGVDKRRKLYRLQVNRIYDIHHKLLKRCALEGKDPAPIHAWEANAEEIVAIEFDIDRMSTQRERCDGSDDDLAKAKYYTEKIGELTGRLVQLENARPGLERAIADMQNQKG